MNKPHRLSRDVIIDIEGIDGVGKGTQSELLCQAMRAKGYDVDVVSFPRYDTFFGKMVGGYLNGTFGGLDGVPVEFATLLYALDRWDYWKTAPSSEQTGEGRVIVIDRYVPSNIAHQAAKLPLEQRRRFAKWIAALEYDVFAIPRPKLVILLDMAVPLATRQILLKPRREYTDQKKDLHEMNDEYLEAVRSEFLSFCEESSNARIVQCASGEHVRSVADLAEEIYELVEGVIATERKTARG